MQLAGASAIHGSQATAPTKRGRSDPGAALARIPARPDAGPMPDQETYTHGHHPSVLRSHRWRTAANSAAYLLPHLRPGSTCWTWAAGRAPSRSTWPRSWRRVGRWASMRPRRSSTRRRAAAAGRGTDVTFAVGDAYALDAADGTFDVVHAHQVLQHLADPVAALRRVGAGDRPGGIVAARDADYAGMHWYPRDPLLDRWLELYRAAARANGGEPDAGRRVLAWAHAAGPHGGHGLRVDLVLRRRGVRQWWGDLWAERVTTSALAWQLTATRPGHGGRAGGHRRRVPRLGGAPRRLVRGAPRRGAVPRGLTAGTHDRQRDRRAVRVTPPRPAASPRPLTRRRCHEALDRP